MTNKITLLDTREIIPGANDRTAFNDRSLSDLAANISEHGLIQPITTRWNDEAGCFQIVAGERRYRACRYILGWEEVPAIIIDATDEEASAIMLAENIARENLDPIDEAMAYQKRLNQFGWTVKELAGHAGVTPTHIRFRVKLLRLRDDIQKLVRDGQLQIGYAQIMSDASLDSNRQLIAIKRLRDNHRPTPAWFRKEVNILKEEQCQNALFDASIFTVQVKAEKQELPQDPPTPNTSDAPHTGNSLVEIIKNQITFWKEAAGAWDSLGKPFKRQECQAAALALSSLI